MSTANWTNLARQRHASAIATALSVAVGLSLLLIFVEPATAAEQDGAAPTADRADVGVLPRVDPAPWVPANGAGPVVDDSAAATEPMSVGGESTGPEEADVRPAPESQMEAEDPEAPELPAAPTEAVEASHAVDSAMLDWPQRVEALAEEIRAERKRVDSADELYTVLAAELWAYQDEVYEALRSRSPDALNQRAILAEMYRARMDLLDWVSPGLRDSMIGGGSDGMREFEREFEHARLDFYFQTLAIPRGLRRIVDGIRDSPLDDLWRLIQLFFGIAIFRIWRRWAKKGIGRARSQILGLRPRTTTQLRLTRVLWYADRLRGPLEWLALLVFASTIFEAGDLEEVSTLLWVVILWLLITRFGLLLLDAVGSRGSTGLTGHNATLRMRSLRLVTAWILFTGLSMDLSLRYAGDGAIYAWVSRSFAILLGPVLLLLLHWWRNEILDRLTAEARHSSIAARLARREKGLASYLNAATGAAYLFGSAIRQFLVRVLSHFEGGRKIVAILLRREVERDGQRESLTEQPVSLAVVERLLAPSKTVIDGPFKDALQRLESLLETGRGAAVSVLAERGGGMSSFLRQLKSDLGDQMAIVDCPTGGFERFREALADEFDLDHAQDLTTALRPRLEERGIRVLAVDNFHRIPRPRMGGLAGANEASRIAEGAGSNLIWVVAMTRAAAPYITRAYGDRAILQEVLELPGWTDEQLEQLFDARCTAAGIEPDYRQLVFPSQYDDGARTTLEERNRFGFRRVLWELSDGNPEVAMRLFCNALRELPNGKLIVRLPQPAPTSTLSSANVTTLLALRCLVECELATLDDLTESIQVSKTTMTNSIAFCIQEGWVEQVGDDYQITWDWYRTIKRMLVRRNLIAR